MCNNSSDQTKLVKESPNAISSQDDELLRILEDLQYELHDNNNRELEVIFAPTLF